MTSLPKETTSIAARLMFQLRTFRDLTFLMILLPVMALGQYDPIGQFRFTLNNGQDFTTAGPDATVQNFEAQRTLAGFIRQNTIATVNAIYQAVQSPIAQCRSPLLQVQAAQQRSDVSGAQSAATQAKAKLADVNTAAKNIGVIGGYGDVNNPTYVALGNAFFKYAANLANSVNEAQSVPAQIQNFIKSNEAGIRLLNAAQGLEGATYKTGMQCSDLLITACHAPGVGVMVTTTPQDGATMTKSWFVHGMGPEFIQLFGGDAGESLDQLAQDEGSGKIAIPIGAVIVADGHAALFDGVVMVDGQWQIITYDANDARSWTVSLSGTPSKTDPEDKMLSFPGHQVGTHVTRLQWGRDHSVKVFQPIGNHVWANLSISTSISTLPPWEQGEVFPIRFCNPPNLDPSLGITPVPDWPTCQ